MSSKYYVIGRSSPIRFFQGFAWLFCLPFLLPKSVKMAQLLFQTGLHQAPRAFHTHITKVLAKSGFKPIHGDPSIFVRNRASHVSFIGLYVDDAIIASTSPTQLAPIRQFLDDHFKLTWTTDPKMLTGIEPKRDRNVGALRFSQRHYAEDILRTFGMMDCIPKKSPLSKSHTAYPKESKPSPDRRFPYLQFIGKLNYLARSTRPDLAFAASHLATFCSTYQEEHWQGCLDVMRFIKGTLDASITYHKTASDQPIGFSDANYAGDAGDRKLVSGYAFVYAGGMIRWKSKKHPVAAHSSTESELVALDSAAREALWLASVFSQLSKRSSYLPSYWKITKGRSISPGTPSRSLREP